MSRLSIYPRAALTCAILVLASGIGPVAAAECSQRFKICNTSCNQLIQAENVGVCKIQCDFRLIACDAQPISFRQDDSLLTGGTERALNFAGGNNPELASAQWYRR
jgi:hypothetical protein